VPATVTTLEREIAREERRVGLPTDRPVRDRDFSRRRWQIAVMMLACAGVALYAVFAASGGLQLCAVALAGGFGVYALEQDRHLHRLAVLCGDSQRITFVIADEIMFSGALIDDRELLDLRDRIGRRAAGVVVALAGLLPDHCTRVRVVGPSGELPIAAECNCGRREPEIDDSAAAIEAVSTRAVVRALDGDRGVMAAALWRGEDAIGVLETIAPHGEHYDAGDAALVDAFGRGVVAALRVRQ
jgi:hypothetical protein